MLLLSVQKSLALDVKRLMSLLLSRMRMAVLLAPAILKSRTARLVLWSPIHYDCIHYDGTYLLRL